MKKFLLISSCFVSMQLYSQYFPYPATNIPVNANNTKNALGLGDQYTFSNNSLYAFYNFNEKYFLYGAFNYIDVNGSNIDLFGFFSYYKYKGFTIGLGRQWTKNKHSIELLAYYSYKDAIEEYYNFWHYFDRETFHLHKFGIVPSYNLKYRFVNLCFALGIGVAKFTNLTYTDYFNSKTYKDPNAIMILEPTIYANFKPFKNNRNFQISIQIGLVSALSKLKFIETNSSEVFTSEESTTFGSGGLGLRYYFNLNKKRE